MVTTLRTAPRILTSLSALALSIGALTGCTPEPEPTPTPTAAFASEEEAFTAAEEVYREYNEAGNARLRGEETPDPQDFLVGAALEGDIDAANLLREQGLHAIGSVRFSSFRGIGFEQTARDVTINAVVCLDVSDTRVLDSTGNDVTPETRPDVVAQTVTFVMTSKGMLLSQEDSADEAQC